VIGVDRKYAERKLEAKQRGYKLGRFIISGKPGDSDQTSQLLFWKTVKPEADDLMALDLDGTDPAQHMSFDEALIFIKRVKEKNWSLSAHLCQQPGDESDRRSIRRNRPVREKTRLWYARFKKKRHRLSSGNLEDLYALAVLK